MMDCTIIIPVYNGQQYLKDAIDSAIIQGCDVVVVNDGSTDNTAIIMDYYKTKISQIHHHTNCGTASALNSGIKTAKTNWIRWLSADDVMYSGSLEKMMSMIQKYDNIENTIFYTHYDRMNGCKLSYFEEPDNSSNSKAVLLDHFYGNGSTSLIHKNVFKKCGLFDEKIGYQEDYEFWLRCVLIYDVRLQLLDIKSIKYRIHDQQLTAQKHGEALHKSDDIRNAILDIVPQYKNLLGTVHRPLKHRIKNRLRKIIY